ncbi:MAG: DUF4827 domain-containing protein [Prevotella sp. AG:487_50_53]|jgi:hypothetical protein|uniref:DUF4827 domain-containing protein n=1 Tax=Leyella lascolaii TaxID=1776379 RepID=A0AAW7JM86_9BACT|nr:DUF4827 domain-containing protein [Leyella lascolaii]MDN0023846.1 DUF4827 domain-containing protein [Leyella lascolaii]MDN0026400.1 DUF4827 domain-containing protein [Leyella lascolaii]OKZ28209.1 MAG: DUF4827 domain-containing protein [Prevotella sp. AG:487_50_53]CCZ14265.1 putative uncharacterized protein [Prevotella sp. CAG:487]
MGKIKLALLACAALFTLMSCDDTESYADQKKKERSAIRSYIAKENIKVITEKEFHAQDSTTDVSKNEYVLFETTGVYMQIIREGCGEKLKDGETATVICRFKEWNLLTDSLQLANNIENSSLNFPDLMSVKNTSGTFKASFIQGSSVMYSIYGSGSVPAGWLAPLSYIKIGRPAKPGEEIAKVKLIVPHTQGHQYASSGVYPCLYEITYQRGY